MGFPVVATMRVVDLARAPATHGAVASTGVSENPETPPPSSFRILAFAHYCQDKGSEEQKLGPLQLSLPYVMFAYADMDVVVRHPNAEASMIYAPLSRGHLNLYLSCFGNQEKS